MEIQYEKFLNRKSISFRYQKSLAITKILLICRSSRPQVFLKILQNTQENINAGVFLIKLQNGGFKPTISLKRDSSTDVNLRNFEEHLYRRAQL